MRLNRFLAQATSMSRRSADIAIAAGKVRVNGAVGLVGQEVRQADAVTLDNHSVNVADETVTIILNKPVGYVCSRVGQGSKTIYDLLPKDLSELKPVGRLDKDSSGIILLTNDGMLANELTHPKFAKAKIYKVRLNKPLSQFDQGKFTKGVVLDDGVSRLKLTGKENLWTVTMSEGRNRQIRRSFAILGYKVTKLHRIQFGKYRLGSLKPGKYINS